MVKNKKNDLNNKVSEKSWITCLVLLWCVPPCHRFYVRKYWTGIFFMFTFGGLGIWWIIDLIKILNYTYTDKSGNYIVKNGSKVPLSISGEERLLKLHELYEKKIISEEEYKKRKNKILKQQF